MPVYPAYLWIRIKWHLTSPANTLYVRENVIIGVMRIKEVIVRMRNKAVCV